MALMGLNEGVNVFLDEDGRARDPQMDIPAYLRRYPFLLPACARTGMNYRFVSTPLPMRSVISRRARRCSTAISRARRPRRS